MVIDALDDAGLRVAIVRTAGEKFFSAGWDLKAAASGDAVDGDEVGGHRGQPAQDDELQDVGRPDEVAGAADTTIKVGWDDWQQMAAGQLDGMTAFMTGKLKVE